MDLERKVEVCPFQFWSSSIVYVHCWRDLVIFILSSWFGRVIIPHLFNLEISDFKLKIKNIKGVRFAIYIMPIRHLTKFTIKALNVCISFKHCVINKALENNFWCFLRAAIMQAKVSSTCLTDIYCQRYVTKGII